MSNIRATTRNLHFPMIVGARRGLGFLAVASAEDTLDIGYGGGGGFFDDYGYFGGGGGDFDFFGGGGDYDYGPFGGDYVDLPPGGSYFDVGPSPPPDIFSGGDYQASDEWRGYFEEGFGIFGDPDLAALYADDLYAAGSEGGVIRIPTSEPGSFELPPAGGYFDVGLSPMPDFDFSSAGVPSLIDFGVEDSGVLPGYCPRGTYHPREDPFACVPFPTEPAARRQAQQQAKQQQQQAGRRQQQMRESCPPGQARYPINQKCVPLACPPGTQRNPATGQCVRGAGRPVPKCPPGQIFDLQRGQCVVPRMGGGLGDIPSWLWLAGLALLVLSQTGGGERRGRR